MDHNEAINLRAVERYTLGELPEDVRDAFEEHFFDCGECAMNMKAMSAFADGAREIFGEEAKVAGREAVPEHGEAKPSRESDAGWWKRLWQPLVAVPTFASLLLFVGYQAWRTGPKAPQQVAAVAEQTAVAGALQTSVHLLGDMRRGHGEVPVLKVRPTESFTMDFDFTPARKFDAYRGELQDAAGRSVLPVTLSGDMADREVHVMVPGGIVRPGKYILAFVGVSLASGSESKGSPVESFALSVEFLP